MSHIELPPIGTLLGSAIYLDRADYVFQTTGRYYTSWVSEDHDPDWYLERVLSERQGNLVILWDGGATDRTLRAAAWWQDLAALGLEAPAPDWQERRFLVPSDWAPLAEHADRSGAGMVRFVAEAARKGIWSYVLYADAAPEWSQKLAAAGGRHYLGYNVGEKFSHRFDSDRKDTGKPSLTGLAAALRAAVREQVEARQASGWGDVMTTSCSFHLDYEIDAGATIPVTEDFAFAHLGMASALARGLYRQYDLPIWGTDIAHEHYSRLPYASPYKYPSLRHAFYLKYLAGCKLIHLESGNWWQQSDHVLDTVMHTTPKVDLGAIHRNDPRQTAAAVPEARKHYAQLGYDSAICRAYRREVTDFYDFLEAEGTPEGQPEARIAVVKGNLDLAGNEFHPNNAIGGAYRIAEENPHWFEGAPERGWDLVRQVFYPRPPVMKKLKNNFFSGTPHGQVDIVSFAGPISAAFLLEHYSLLIFCGWNTATEEQYRVLVEYVRGGGTLFISIPHLSTDDTRNYTGYAPESLVNGGDFTELCGVKVKGRGGRFYWATTPEMESPLGFARPQKYGVYCTRVGELEMTGSPEVLLVEDEQFRPLLLRHQCGRGQTYFLNSWDYPGAMAGDMNLSSLADEQGLLPLILRHLAMQVRGRVFITDDGQAPGPECDFIAWSWFPEANQVLAYNIDFDRPHELYVHLDGASTHVRLAPGELRRFDLPANSVSRSELALTMQTV